MQFLFIAPRYHTNTHYMIQALKNQGHKVSFFSIFQGESENHSLVEPKILGFSGCFRLINKLFNHSPYKLFVMRNSFELKYAHPNLFKLFYYIKKDNPDFIIIKNINSVYSLFSLMIGRFLGKRLIVLMQLPKYRKQPVSRSVRWVARLFGARVFTPILGDTKYQNFNNNLFYAPFVIDSPDFDKKYFQNNKINILCVGKFQERKNQLLLAQAINNLKNNFDIHATFIGEADEKPYTEKLKKYIADNNLSEIIQLKNNISHQEMIDFYRQYDLFILPSYHESAAFSILEAMAAKLAVICSDDNGTREYIKEGQSGYVFEHKNLDDLTAKIKLIISDRSNIEKMGKASFDLARQKHNPDIFYNSLNIKFIITVDTEADNQWQRPSKHTVKNIQYLSRFQAICEKYGFLPTYLVTYEVAANQPSVDILKPWQDQNKAEIGAHLHPWTTPPLQKDQALGTKIHRFPSELPEAELKDKLVNLTSIIETNFKKRPISFRAGRWGADHKVIKQLEDLNYKIDCSVTPKVSWQNIHGPDFRLFKSKPYFWPESKILEAPMSILFTGLFKKENSALASLFLRLPDSFIKKVINRLFFRQKWFRIFANSAIRDFKRLYQSAQKNNLDYIEFMIHSSELMPGASIYNKDEKSVEALYKKLEDLFKYLKDQSVPGITLSDYAKIYDQAKN